MIEIPIDDDKCVVYALFKGPDDKDPKFEKVGIDPHEALKALEEQAPEVLMEWEGLHFVIVHPGESAAGINAFSDDVFIRCASDDWGGEPGEFESYIKDCLSEWYDGAQVISDKEADEWYQASLVDGKVIAKTLKDFSEDLK